MVIKKSKKFDTGTIGFALKNFWVDYVGWGRARRSEYWWVYLFYGIIFPFLASFAINFVGAFCAIVFESEGVYKFFEILDAGIGFGWFFATLTPYYCLTARRLHDTNRSNWNILWLLLPVIGWIVLIVFLCQKGDTKKNRFGEPRM